MKSDEEVGFTSVMGWESSAMVAVDGFWKKRRRNERRIQLDVSCAETEVNAETSLPYWLGTLAHGVVLSLGSSIHVSTYSRIYVSTVLRFQHSVSLVH